MFVFDTFISFRALTLNPDSDEAVPSPLSVAWISMNLYRQKYINKRRTKRGMEEGRRIRDKNKTERMMNIRL